jgi:hypothetical protein
MTEITCPFGPCTARLVLVEHRAVDLGTPAISTIPAHPTLPDTWFGECPASGMAWPISEPESATLREQRGVHSAAFDARINDSARREHLLTPKPTKNPKWFQNSDGDPKIPGHAVTTPRLRLVPDPEPEPERPKLSLVKGGKLASVAEVRAAIDVANDNAERAAAKIAAAIQETADALTQINYVRATSVDPLGGPMIETALEKLDEAIGNLSAAIEANNTYRSTL